MRRRNAHSRGCVGPRGGARCTSIGREFVPDLRRLSACAAGFLKGAAASARRARIARVRRVVRDRRADTDCIRARPVDGPRGAQRNGFLVERAAAFVVFGRRVRALHRSLREYVIRAQTLPSFSMTRMRASPSGCATCSVPADAWNTSPASSIAVRSTPASR